MASSCRVEEGGSLVLRLPHVFVLVFRFVSLSFYEYKLLSQKKKKKVENVLRGLYVNNQCIYQAEV